MRSWMPHTPKRHANSRRSSRSSSGSRPVTAPTASEPSALLTTHRRRLATAQVDIPSDYQDIVGSLVRKQVPKIQEAELLKLRENDAADKATAKELIVDGAAYKV